MRALRPDVTDGPRRWILENVRAHPGIHLREIERRTTLPLGQVLYHLDRLERMGILASHRDCGFRRYFSSDRISHGEKPILAAFRHDVPRRVLLRLLESPGLTHKELQAHAGVAGSTLSFHLQRLVDAGVLVRAREGGFSRYALRDPTLARRQLVAYGGSFDDPAVDDFLSRSGDEPVRHVPVTSPEPTEAA